MNKRGLKNLDIRMTRGGLGCQFVCCLLWLIGVLTSEAATIWPSTTVPALVDGGADNSVELGVKFRSDVAGSVTGIRFYKSGANTGSHVGNLWSNSGSRLATVTFVGESGSGWQEMSFGSPVPIAANTIYVVSYHANNGHYSADLGYFSGKGADNAPLHALANGVSGGNGVYAYGSSSLFPTQTYNTANYWVDVVFVAGGNGGPVAITTASLPDGVVNSAYSATLSASGGTAPYLWAVGNLPAGLTVNPSSGTISGVVSSTGTFALNIQVSDASTPVQTVSKTLNLTIGAVPVITTLWPASVVPGVVDSGADRAVELGVKFRSDAAGRITGIRYYKSTANTGTHVGNLWSSSGTLLASATFSGESSAGWQQVNFGSPVPIAADTVYVASYHAANGHYSADPAYFSGSGVDRPPLHALMNGVSGGNGVFAYGTGSQFPTNTRNSANYWVDVVYDGTVPPDNTAPTISSVNPGSGSSAVSINSSILVTFNEAMSPSSINGETIQLRDNNNALVAGTITFDSSSKTATLTPASALSGSTLYNGLVKGGGTGVSDLAGNRLSADFRWQFTTGNGGGSGGGGTVGQGPILLLTSSGNPFSTYLSEILLAEGLNLFARTDISSLTSAGLAGYDVVILGQTTLSAGQVTILSDWVNGGGKLIAMRPDKQLASLFGLSDAGGTLAEGYLLVNTSSGPGVGIVAETIKFHGVADRYNLSGASSLAALYSSAQNATSSPAVTLRNVGASGGQAVAFTFDIARSIVYTRQGNPAWAGQDRDGLSPQRSNDLFYGAASFDPQPDWNDLTKLAIPQADEQQRLLANIILTLESTRKLLPRFWYFPNGYQAAIVMTGDDHGTGGTSGRFDHYINLSRPGASVDDWEAIRGSSYMYPSTPLSNQKAASYSQAGFDMAMHLNTDCSDYTREGLRKLFSDQIAQFKNQFASLPALTTHRIHCVAWSGYTILPEVEFEYGIRMNTSYYFYPGDWVQDRPGLFTGSGLPMRFASSSGNLIDVYQAATQMTDESGQTYPFTADTLLDRALGPEGYYGAFVANMHTDQVVSADSDAIISSATSRGVPTISARQLLTWTDGRNASILSSITWANSVMSFGVEADPRARGLQVMIPIPQGSRVSQVRYNGSVIAATVKRIKGVNYSVVSAQTGNYQATFESDSAAPSVVSVQPANGQSGVPVNSKVNVSFSKPMAAASINASTISLRNSSGVLSASVSYNASTLVATLVPNTLLNASATYTVSVQGGVGGVTDSSGNPMPASYSSTFTTGAVASQVYTIWPDSVTPSVLAANDSGAVELGLRFRSSVNGLITKIRFYKSVGNTGQHVGSLWTAGGTRLASVVFTNESGSGWQSQTLASPLAISANTTYVVSYYAPVGRYAFNGGYFASSGIDNPPLRALADGESGSNGVYRYGSGNLFPNQSYNSSNYWVDVEFVPGN